MVDISEVVVDLVGSVGRWAVGWSASRREVVGVRGLISEHLRILNRRPQDPVEEPTWRPKQFGIHRRRRRANPRGNRRRTDGLGQ